MVVNHQIENPMEPKKFQKSYSDLSQKIGFGKYRNMSIGELLNNVCRCRKDFYCAEYYDWFKWAFSMRLIVPAILSIDDPVCKLFIEADRAQGPLYESGPGTDYDWENNPEAYMSIGDFC